MLYSMSVLFRSQLKENDWITVGQELDYCKQYLELFECRFQGIFQYEIDCPVELLGTKVIKFICSLWLKIIYPWDTQTGE